MADYKQQNLTGQRWTRAFRVLIENPFGGVPSITFNEEGITTLSDGSVVNSPCGSVGMQFTDPTAVVQLRDPVTNEPIDGAFMTHGQIYAALSSLYLAAAEARDLPPTPPPA